MVVREVLWIVYFVVQLESKPHILFVLVDDLGWANVGFNREQPTPEVVTPVMNSLVEEGIHLTRHYVHQTCTPTRSAFHSGRLPVHVQTQLYDPDKPNSGIPRNMTGIGTKMQQGGYATHFVGKWDAGMATPFHTPHGRGYQTSLNYFCHKNDYWNQVEMQSSCPQSLNIEDLWLTDKPAYGLNKTKYEEYLFQDQIQSIIKNHDPTNPLFLVYAPHVIHCPLQVPKDVLDKFSFMENDEGRCQEQTPYIYPNFTGPYKCRQTYHSMVNLLDGLIGQIIDSLRMKNMWQDTLMVLSSDNGGPLTLIESGANNYPLRGGKYSDFEGGIRSVAFVSGGYLPTSVQGTKLDEIIHVADWYTTFCNLAGVSEVDEWAKASGLPPVDGLNMLPLIMGQTKTSPRKEVPVSVNTLISDNFKLIKGSQEYSGWTGPAYPNASSPDHNPIIQLNCGSGCLFDVKNDPTEHIDLANQRPEIVTQLTARLTELQKGFYSNNEVGKNSCPPNIKGECACWMAVNKYGGFFGPYQEVSL